MKKLSFLIISLLAISLAACNDEDDVINTALMKGHWEIEGNDHFEYTAIYDFQTSDANIETWGTLTSYYIIAPDNRIEDNAVYDWHITDPVNTKGDVELSLTPTSYSKTDAADTDTKVYKVEKLTASDMLLVLKNNQIKATTATKLHLLRRSDLD